LIAFDTDVLVYSFEVGEKAEVARRLGLVVVNPFNPSSAQRIEAAWPRA